MAVAGPPHEEGRGRAVKFKKWNIGAPAEPDVTEAEPSKAAPAVAEPAREQTAPAVSEEPEG